MAALQEERIAYVTSKEYTNKQKQIEKKKKCMAVSLPNSSLNPKACIRNPKPRI